MYKRQIGPSGSGKSTFLRCLNLLEQPTSGEIIVDGETITERKADINKVRRHIGMVFQQFNLFPHMSVLENIMMAPVTLKLKSKAEAEKKAKELLERVGLSDKADYKPADLSGGQQQRVAIARALAMEPDIMPVSYTHLDVYKRQAARMIPFTSKISRALMPLAPISL